MQNIKKYSIGIVLCFSILAIEMIYVMPMGTLFLGRNNFKNVFIFSRAAIWFCLFLVAVYAQLVEKGRFLIWKEQPKSWKFYMGAVPVLYFICILGNSLINIILQHLSPEKISDKLIGLKFLFKNNFLLIVFTALTAAITEEFLMRGYIQPRLTAIYRNKWVAIVGSALIFGLLHTAYGTIMQVVGPFFIGLVFAVFYDRFRNIKTLIICHFLIDMISISVLTYANLKAISSLI